MAGIPPPGVMNNFVTSLRSNAFATMERAVNDTIAEGYSVPLILSMLAEIIINDDSVSDVNKARLSIRIAEADKNLVDGAHETLQLMSVGSMGLRCLAPSSSGR